MLQENLTPCATLLYQWIVRKISNKNNMVKLDMRDFQAWSAEFRDFPYSEREILQAFKQLKQLELINVAKTEVTVRAKNWNSSRGSRLPLGGGLRANPIYMKSCLVILLAAGLFGALKFAPAASGSTWLQTQLQNLKLPNSGQAGGGK